MKQRRAGAAAMTASSFVSCLICSFLIHLPASLCSIDLCCPISSLLRRLCLFDLVHGFASTCLLRSISMLIDGIRALASRVQSRQLNLSMNSRPGQPQLSLFISIDLLTILSPTTASPFPHDRFDTLRHRREWIICQVRRPRRLLSVMALLSGTRLGAAGVKWRHSFFRAKKASVKVH